MKVSLAWLRAVAPDLDLDPDALGERLAARGAPVEEMENLAGGLGDIVVARVASVEEHPDADRLRLCLVVPDEGAEPVQVVCGAPNVEAARLYPFAPAGATLPGGMRIGTAELRGQRSEGMLCSARELGLGTDQSGLMELPAGLEAGTRLVDALALEDWRLDVEVTANRGDLLSHRGVAREVAPDGEASLAWPEIPGGVAVQVELVTDVAMSTAGGATVRIEDPDLCRRYLGAVIRGVRVGPSPAWLQTRLRAAGARPVNNVVDATNYVLLETGQPLHAFDLATLTDATIVVRRARADEPTFVTLDGEERKLTPDMLMICDAAEPVALAGVMGGLDSEVTDDTTDVLLECALFDPANIRATRRAMNISTDASYRFERGVDPAGMVDALRRALEIILATAGGKLEPRVADCAPRPWQPRSVELRAARVEHLLGVPFTPLEIRELLEPLGFAVTGEEGGVLTVTIPGWRDYDVTREVDLIEEVARTRGYDAFPEELAPYRPGTVPDHPLFSLEDGVRDLLVARGLFEAQTPAFVPASEGDVAVLNPVSREEDHLRRELLPSLVRRVEHNWSHGVRDVRLFELGTSFRSLGAGELPREEPRVAVVLTGRSSPPHWSSAERTYDIWDVKGLLESVVARVRPDAWVEPGAPGGKGLVRGEGFTVRCPGDETVGWGGRIAPEAVDAAAWADALLGMEVTLPSEPRPVPPVHHDPLPPFPGVERDLALLVPESVPAERVRQAIVASGGEHLREVTLFDRYVGKGVGEGLRSLAWRMRFQSRERTLTDDDVDRATERVTDHLRSELGVEPRA